MMTVRFLRAARWLAVLAVVCTAGPLAAQTDDDFRNARAEILVKLRSGRAEDRLEAIDQLEQYPTGESAELIVRGGLHFNDQRVRTAASRALWTLCDNEDVCNRLLETLQSEIRGGDPEVIGPLIRVLRTSEFPAIREKLVDLLGKSATNPSRTPPILWVAASEAVEQADAPAVAFLVRLAELPSFAADFSFRRGIVQGLISIRHSEAVAALVGLLADLRGEVRGDVVKHLATLSGEDFGTDAGAWRTWWDEHGPSFKFPDPVALPAPVAPVGPADPRIPLVPAPIPEARPARDHDTASYYDIPIYADRMVFVIDASGSMAGARMAAAKQELIEAIGGLPPTAWFNVVVYNTAARAWQRRLVQATPATQQLAARFVASLVPTGQTASYDAIEMAMSFDAEAVFFLSDGAPTMGKIVQPAAIVRAVTEANRNRRVSIYSIGILPGPPGSPLVLFLQELAEKNFGVYRQVDR